MFSLGSERKTADKHALLLEVGEDYCCYAYFEEHTQSFNLINYFSFDDLDIDVRLHAILDELREERFSKIIACSSFLQALLVPQKYQSSNNALLDVIYEPGGHHGLSDNVPEWQLNIVYSIPLTIFDLIQKELPDARFFHVYTPAIKLNSHADKDHMCIHFSLRFFRVVLKIGQQVQLVETYSYKTPLDVVYYLVKICYEFKIDQSGIFIFLSGLIEAKSALYLELQNYFLNLEFEDFPPYSIPVSEHPHYYFQSLYNLALCAS